MPRANRGNASSERRAEHPEVQGLPFDSDKKRLIEAIVNTFETGNPAGDYSAVALLEDGAGISYGRSQATDHADNLDRIVYRYHDLGGQHARELIEFIDELEADATAAVDPRNPPSWCRALMSLLATAGTDPLMRRAQDEIFEERYWVPAQNQALSMQLALPLSWAVVYDTVIHSGPDGVARMRKRFRESPPSKGGDEEAWTSAYVAARHAWLASHAKPVVRTTTYRTRTFRRFIDGGNWELEPPLIVLGASIS